MTNGRLRTVWREAPQLTKTLCKWLPALGSILIALGVLGDSRGWWDNRSFLTNLVSSFTGLLFAVPFALVVLSRLGEAHALLAEQRAVRRYGGRIVSELLGSSRHVTPLGDGFFDDGEMTLPDWDNLVERARSLPDANSGTVDRLAIEEVHRFMRSHFNPAQRNILINLGPSGILPRNHATLMKGVARVREVHETLCNDVRSRYAEVGLMWPHHVRARNSQSEDMDPWMPFEEALIAVEFAAAQMEWIGNESFDMDAHPPVQNIRIQVMAMAAWGKATERMWRAAEDVYRAF